MILVVGATGALGSEICSRLRREQAGVRALVRQLANPDRLAVLRNAGVELCPKLSLTATAISGSAPR
jgi:uncharacterized protein YbjT (DUF2867 family)